MRANPYPLYRQLRDERPVSQWPFGGIVLARYADCATAFRDPRVSSDERNSNAYQARVASGELSAEDHTRLDERVILFRDPPDHTRLRRLVTKAFTPRMIEQLRPIIQQHVDVLIDRAAGRDRIELIADVACPLPTALICRMLGAPLQDHPRFPFWTRHLMRSIEPPFMLTAQDWNGIRQTFEDLSAYFEELIARRRSDPGDDLLSSLLAVAEHGDCLTPGELNAICRLLLSAGHTTTFNLIANGMLALLRHPDQLERLRVEPALAASTVEEVLRYDPPVHLLYRIALEDLEFDGSGVDRGNSIILLPASAGRDPDEFTDPDRFDIGRADPRHLAFGAGPHFCLGASLARMEGAIALQTLAERLVDPALATDQLRYTDNLAIRSLAELPITFRDVKPARVIARDS
ncbi:MAG: cytochrome P450 [Egibacteraceae bacterium]